MAKTPYFMGLMACGMSLVVGCISVFAQSVRIASVDVDSNGVIQVVTTGGEQLNPPTEPDQISLASPKLAEDERTAGWLVNDENCCTSYPIPLELAIYRDGKITHRFRPGQSI